MDWILIYANIPYVLNVIGIILVATQFKAKQNYIKLLGLLLVTSVANQLCTMFFFFAFRINPNYFFNSYVIIEFVLITMVYYFAFNKAFTKRFVLISVIFLSFAFWNLFSFQKLAINSYTMTIVAFIFMSYSVFYFYWLLKELPTSKLQRLPMFWINTSVLVFFSGKLFVVVFTAYLVEVLNSDLKLYWGGLHNTLAILHAAILTTAIWIDLQNMRAHA